MTDTEKTLEELMEELQLENEILKHKLQNYSDIIKRYRQKLELDKPDDDIELVAISSKKIDIEGMQQIRIKTRYRLPIEPDPNLLIEALKYAQSKFEDDENRWVEEVYYPAGGKQGWYCLVEENRKTEDDN